MRTNGEKVEDQRKAGQRTATPPSRRAPGTAPAGPAAQLLALQSSVGNAAVVQLLRESGDPWLTGQHGAEEHRHGAGCGHEAPQAVQRSSVPDVLRGSGRPLDSTTLNDMQARMGGADFSDVRVHDDAAARASAAEIGARAYTSGNHIVLGSGGTDKHTLAHELTHVIQQRQGPVAGTADGSGLKMSDPSDRFERQAEANASRVMSGGSSLLGPQQAPADGVQRATATATTGAASAEHAEQAGSIQRARYAPGEEVTAHPGFCVILNASLNGFRLGHYTSETASWSPRDHAEDQLCDEIERAITFASSGHLGIATMDAGGDVLEAISHRMYQGKNSHTLRVVLSASPCSTRRGTTTKHEGEDGCAERLIHLARMRFGQDRDQRIKIKIKAKHLYQPSHMRGREGKAASSAALNDMRSAGIEIDVD